MKRGTVMMVTVFLIFSTQLFSQPDHSFGLQKIIGKLNLTEAQRKDVEKIGVDMAKQMVTLKANLATAKIDLRQLLKADIPEKSAIEKKINEMANIGVQLRMNKINSWFAINKLLTPEQQKIWKKVLENAPAMRERRMKNQFGERHMPQQHRHESQSQE